MTTSFFKTDFTFRIGARQFTLKPPAKVLLFAYLAKFAIVLLIGIANMIGAFSLSVARPLAVGLMASILVVEPLVIAYFVYLNNCLVVGDCHVLAWILSSVGVATSVITVVMAILPIVRAATLKKSRR